MVFCLERDADLHTAQLMPLPPTVSCFSKIQIGFTFLVPAHPVSPGQTAVKRVRACACVTCPTGKQRAGLYHLHDDEEQRQVRVTSGAVAVEVDPRAHLVSVAARVERLRVERQDAAVERLAPALGVVADLPDEHAVVVGRLEALAAQVELRQTHVVHSHRAVVRDHLLAQLLCTHTQTLQEVLHARCKKVG